MGDFSKPKVTIDLDEYNTLLENSDPKTIQIYNHILSLVVTEISKRDDKMGNPFTYRELCEILLSQGFVLESIRHRDQIEVKGFKLLK